MTTIKAIGKLHGHDIEAIAVNPGGWFGLTWLIEIGGSYSPMLFAVEADSASDAIDEFSDSPYGHHIHVAPEDMGDYDAEHMYYDANGRPCDLDWLLIHGREGSRQSPPWPCRYIGDGIPDGGIPCTEYDTLEEHA